MLDQNSRTNGILVEETGNFSEPEIRTIVAEVFARAFFPGRPTQEHRDRAREWGYKAIVPRQDYKDARVRPGRNTLETIRVMCERDPDASKAMLNILLLMGQGYQSKANRGKDKDGKPIISQRAQTYITELDTRVGQEYGGGMDAVIFVLARSVIEAGAMALEAELAEDLRSVVDFHPVEPSDISFKREEGTGRLMRGVQVSKSVKADGFQELNPEQFRYIPFMPRVNAPYGYPPFLSAIAPILFKVEILDDLRATIHNQGYPRLDISVIMEKMIANLPPALQRKDNEAKLKEYVTSFITDVAEQYKALNPDDSFVHSDAIQVEYKGPNGSINFRELSTILDNQIVAGVKQLPIMLGRNEGATTTHATIQWRIQALQIGSFQRIMKRMIEWAHNLALRVGGFAETVAVEFESQPVGDRKLEAEAESTEIANWITLADRGWATEDEGANATVGHPAVAAPKPVAVPAATPAATDTGGGTNVNPDTGTTPTEQARGGATLRSTTHTVYPDGRIETLTFRTGGTDGDDYPVQPEDGERGPGEREQAPEHHPGAESGIERLEIDRTSLRHVPGQVRDPEGIDGGHHDEHGGGEAANEGDDDPGADPGVRRTGIPIPKTAEDLGRQGQWKKEEIEWEELWEDDDRLLRIAPLPEVYATRLQDSETAISALAGEVQPEIAARFSALASDFPSGAVASGSTTAAEWFATDAGTSWTSRFRTILTDHYKVVFDSRGTDVLNELGVEGEFFLSNPDLLRILEDTALTRITGMNDHTIEVVGDVVAAGLTAGDHPSAIGAALVALIEGMTTERAETIARTETAHVYSYSAMENYRRNGVKRKIWLTAEDDRVDPPCNDYGDRGSIPIDDLFGDIHDHPPAHPRCRCAIIADLTDAEVPDEPWTGG